MRLAELSRFRTACTPGLFLSLPWEGSPWPSWGVKAGWYRAGRFYDVPGDNSPPDSGIGAVKSGCEETGPKINSSLTPVGCVIFYSFNAQAADL